MSFLHKALHVIANTNGHNILMMSLKSAQNKNMFVCVEFVSVFVWGWIHVFVCRGGTCVGWCVCEGGRGWCVWVGVCVWRGWEFVGV